MEELIMKKIIKIMLILIIILGIVGAVLYFTGVFNLFKDTKLNNIEIPENTEYIETSNTQEELENNVLNFLEKFNNGEITWYKESNTNNTKTKETYLAEINGYIEVSYSSVFIAQNNLKEYCVTGTEEVLKAKNINGVTYSSLNITSDNYINPEWNKEIKTVDLSFDSEKYNRAYRKPSTKSDKEYVDKIKGLKLYCDLEILNKEVLKNKLVSIKIEEGIYKIKFNEISFRDIETDGKTYIKIDNYSVFYINCKSKIQDVINTFNSYDYKINTSEINEADLFDNLFDEYFEQFKQLIQVEIPHDETYEITTPVSNLYSTHNFFDYKDESLENPYFRIRFNTEFIDINVLVYFDSTKAIEDGVLNATENNINYNLTSNYITKIKFNGVEYFENYELVLNKSYVNIDKNYDGTYNVLYEYDYILKIDGLEISVVGKNVSSGTYEKINNKYYDSNPTSFKQNVVLNIIYKDFISVVY